MGSAVGPHVELGVGTSVGIAVGIFVACVVGFEVEKIASNRRAMSEGGKVVNLTKKGLQKKHNKVTKRMRGWPRASKLTSSANRSVETNVQCYCLIF